LEINLSLAEYFPIAISH